MNALNPLNPAAGDVPVPEDPREIDAALRAGKTSYRLFPYLECRYGERGRKFTRSDSAWLAWLSHHQQQFVEQQVTWLRSVLTNRGMPSLILQVHLKVLVRCLTQLVPGRQATYQTLAASAERLRLDREGVLPAPCQQQLVGQFVTAFDTRPAILLTGTAELVVAAVADEKLGERNAVTSLESWITDVAGWRNPAPVRQRLTAEQQRYVDAPAFPGRWSDALARMIASARKA